jgi:hypothetical protein
MKSPLATIVAILAGLVILAGTFIPIPLLKNIQANLLDWAVTLAGVAALVAIFQLVFRVHWKRMLSGSNHRDLSSAVVVLGFLLTFILGIVLGPANAQFQKFIQAVQVPIEASLMALLVITLVVASLRLVQRRKGWMGWLFLFSALVFLVLYSGILDSASATPMLKQILAAAQRLPVAGARGLLLGIALGSLTAGLRILLGSDRPYSG